MFPKMTDMFAVFFDVRFPTWSFSHQVPWTLGGEVGATLRICSTGDCEDPVGPPGPLGWSTGKAAEVDGGRCDGSQNGLHTVEFLLA